MAISAASERYRSLSRAWKQRLLDELEALSGYHRKSLLRRLNQRTDQQQSSRRGQHRRRYGPEVVEALVPLWEASDRLCGKRLHALLPQLVESLEHHGHLQLEQSVRARVLMMSSATIDRLLAQCARAVEAMDGDALPGPTAVFAAACRCARSRDGMTTSSPAGWRSIWWPTAGGAWKVASFGLW
ncbi:hypothetical protein [Synechococcus sp. CB0101]|uniref:hypothetical protein n=1 Tax=Synechococcus sp. CB0101 TaxID=232348 RepID=UPI001FF05238|nr:hypothetical protein [Synechococcus sp. CB0101]